ncbi:histone H1.8 [Falco naumanni]|uniref:histone H1.8 n=1 Tax=Falco naumanni TaxID=148594 RepID=UPI001ADE23A1|nr:histone H1.8 [Falco naumanni]
MNQPYHHVPLPGPGTAQLPHLPAQGQQPRRPSTLHIVTEALQAQDKRKGASIVAIKRFILAKYPTVDPGHLGDLLKQALSKGLSCGDLVRPHNSSAMGATGCFKLAPEKLRQKQTMDQVDPIRGQVPKVGRKGTVGVHSSEVKGWQCPGLPQSHGEATAQAGTPPLLPQAPWGVAWPQRSRSQGQSPWTPHHQQQRKPGAMEQSPHELPASPGPPTKGTRGPLWL